MARRPPLWFVLAGVSIVALAVVAWCSIFAQRNPDRWPELERAVAAAWEQKQTISLAAVADFDWDELYVFGPYTSDEAIERALGRPWDDDDAAALGSNEGLNLLVFVRGQDVVRDFLLPRPIGDFSQLDVVKVARRDAVFDVTRTRAADGGAFYVLEPARPA